MDQFTVSLPLTIRLAVRKDLRALEWGGFWQHREIIEDAYARQKLGENAMLLAVTGDFPAGQTWIDLVRKRRTRTGLLWAVRVFPAFQRRGIGRRLIRAAEDYLSRAGYHRVELGVEKENARAQAFYERLGYRRCGDLEEEYSYTTPEGQFVRVRLDEWLYEKELT